MKKLFLALLLLAIIAYFSACEKDDICVEGDTPLLVIGFYDVDDPTAFKTVSLLRIRALLESANETSLNNAEDFGFTDRSNVIDSIQIPLQIAESKTTFAFISASEDDDEGNETGIADTLEFSYTVNEKFISRACGFVANFNDLAITRQVSTSDWIKDIIVREADVELSNTIHVQIFH